MAAECAEALRNACAFGSIDVARTLCLSPRLQMYIDGASEEHGTALMAAADAGRADSVQLLISYGADVNATDGLGRSALMLAAAQGATELLAPLLRGGIEPADAFLKANNGWTALMFACAAGREETVDELLRLVGEGGADALLALVEQKDNDGQTALEIARVHGRVALLEALTKALLVIEDERATRHMQPETRIPFE